MGRRGWGWWWCKKGAGLYGDPQQDLGRPQHEHVRAVTITEAVFFFLFLPHALCWPFQSGSSSVTAFKVEASVTVFTPNGGCSLIPFPSSVCLRFCSHYCWILEFPQLLGGLQASAFLRLSLLFLILAPEAGRLCRI